MLEETIAPIAFSEIKEQLKLNDPVEATIYSALALQGLRVSTYDNGLKEADVENVLKDVGAKPQAILSSTPEWIRKTPKTKEQFKEDFNNALGMYIADNIIDRDDLSDKQKKKRIDTQSRLIRKKLIRDYKEMRRAD